MPRFIQDGWRGWLLGILATIIGSLIINGIAFQRETRETLARQAEQLTRNAERADNILKYLDQRINERQEVVRQELITAERRTDKIVEIIESIDRKIVTAPDVGRELFARDEIIRRLEKRIEELEKRR